MYYSLEDINYYKQDTKGKFNAGNKAHEDVARFLLLEQLFLIDREANLIKDAFSVLKRVIKYKNKKVLLQYPMYMKKGLYRFVRFNKSSICIVHDIFSLRRGVESKIQTDISRLNSFKCIIVHNHKMMEWLKEHGCKTKMISLEIFDYATDSGRYSATYNRDKVEIAFAGNISKSEFVKKIPDLELDNISWKIFGVKNEGEIFPEGLIYSGKFIPDNIPEELARCNFGLIWDGPETSSCKGVLGEYLKYNNPHKCSLYLAAGVPVIIWKEAALADYVLDNKCGIVIGSISELKERLNDMSETEYDELRKNAFRLSEELRDGLHIKKAFNEAVKQIG